MWALSRCMVIYASSVLTREDICLNSLKAETLRSAMGQEMLNVLNGNTTWQRQVQYTLKVYRTWLILLLILTGLWTLSYIWKQVHILQKKNQKKNPRTINTHRPKALVRQLTNKNQ